MLKLEACLPPFSLPRLSTSPIMSDSSVRQARSPVTFAANGEHFVSGSTDGVRVWRMEDGKLMATIRAEHVQCVAFSKDGKWIAAGTYDGDVMVWDAKIYRQARTTWRTNDVIRGVEFSPNSAQLVVFGDHTATVWDITTRERRVGPLRHEDCVLAAKYSPEGDRIATATGKSVRVYDSNDGHPLVDIEVNVAPLYNSGLLWFNNHLVVISDNQIKQMDASTGTQIWEWAVPNTSNPVCIAIPKHGQLIAYSANRTDRTVTFWDTSTRTQFGLVNHPQDIHSIALSPDGRFLAIGGENETITIKRLSRIIVSIISSHWVIACLNNFLVPFHPSILLSPLYPLTRNQTFISTTLHSITGGTTNSRMQKRH